MIVFSVSGVMNRKNVSITPSNNGAYVIIGDMAFTLDKETLDTLKYEVDSFFLLTSLGKENA
jgi:hypothetical protein